MADVVFALDPGQTTGWAMLRRTDREVLGMGDLGMEDLGCAIDILTRTMHVSGYSLRGVVELLPSVSGVASDLQVDLAFVRQTIDHWLVDVFELDVDYILPSVWKTSRIGRTLPAPAEWNGGKTSPHMRGAYLMGNYWMAKK